MAQRHSSKGLADVRRLLALSEGHDFVCYRYRLAAFSAALRAAGWELVLLRRPRGAVEFTAALRWIRAADAVIVQRRLLGWAKAALVRRCAGTLIYDFDDAVFSRDSNASHGPDDPRRWQGFRRMVRAADATLAGSTHLREQANRCGAPERIHRLPTCVDTGRYELAAHDRPAGTAELVWVGSRSTMPSLVEARGCLAAAAAAKPGVTLNVICDVVPNLDGIPLRTTEWSAATETRDIARADIGIAWLPDHPWSLGKCGLKVLQYMAAGLPVVANAVGIHRELVEHGVTGFLANDPQEWRAAVTALVESPALRRCMGAAARARVERDWSVQCWGPRLATILSETADARSAKRAGGRAA